jgi:hypothetical protein
MDAGGRLPKRIGLPTALPSHDSLEAGVFANREAIRGEVGYRRGPVAVGLNGGVTWRREWFAGARAVWKF